MRAWNCRQIHLSRTKYAPPHHSSPTARSQHSGPLPSNEQLSASLNSIKHTTIRANRESNGSVNHDTDSNAFAPTAHDLPQSPLTDLRLNAARFGITQPKPVKQGLSDFQLKLQQNAYAHALASPVRQCLLTNTRLPKDFLIQYGIATHPDTGNYWHLPTLAVDVLRTQKATNELDIKPSDVTVSKQEGNIQAAKNGLPPRSLSGTNILSSYKALKLISGLSASKHHAMLPFRWRDNRAIKGKDIVWREDMAEFVLKLMREEVVHWIDKLFSKKAGVYIAPCADWEDVQEQANISAVLSLRDGSENPVIAPGKHFDATDIEAGQLLPFCALARYDGSKVPVYALESLLGSASLKSLRGKFPESLGEDYAVIRKGRSTMGLQTKLWKLIGYLSG